MFDESCARQSRDKTLIGLFIILVLGLALRLIFMTRNGIWFDESLVLHYVDQPFSKMFAMIRVGEQQPPAHHVLMYLYCFLFGTHPQWVVEIPSVVLSMVAVLYAYRVGREMFDSSTGLTAAAFLAFSSYFLKYSWEIRPYVMMSLLSIMSTFYMLRYLREPSRIFPLVVFIITTSLNMHTHYFAVFTTLAQNLYVVIYFRKRETLYRWIGGNVVACALFVPWGLVFLSQLRYVTEGSMWIPPLTLPFFLGHLFLLVSFNFQKFFFDSVNLATDEIVWSTLPAQAWLIIAIPFLIMALGLIRFRYSKERSGVLFWFMYLLVPVTLVTFFSLTVQPMFQQRYLAAAMPALPMLAAVGFRSFRPIIRFSLFFLLLVLSIVDTAYMIKTPQDMGPKRLANYIDRECTSEDAIVALSGYYFFPLLYYDEGKHDIRVFLTDGGRDALRTEVKLEQLLTEVTAPLLTEANDRLFVFAGYYYDETYKMKIQNNWPRYFRTGDRSIKLVRRAGPLGQLYLCERKPQGAE